MCSFSLLIYTDVPLHRKYMCQVLVAVAIQGDLVKPNSQLLYRGVALEGARIGARRDSSDCANR